MLLPQFSETDWQYAFVLVICRPFQRLNWGSSSLGGAAIANLGWLIIRQLQRSPGYSRPRAFPRRVEIAIFVWISYLVKLVNYVPYFSFFQRTFFSSLCSNPEWIVPDIRTRRHHTSRRRNKKTFDWVEFDLNFLFVCVPIRGWIQIQV